MLRGFDLSSAQGTHPFDNIPPEYRFVIVKCWTGNDGGDPYYAKNVAAAQAAGMVVLPYVFAYPLHPAQGHPGRDPTEQAKLFVDHAWAVLPGSRLVIDMEWPAPQDWGHWSLSAASICAWMQECCEEVTRLCDGLKPIIYTYLDWWNHVAAGADVSWAADYDLWMAWYIHAWPAEGADPRMPKPWTSWLFWQWDGNGGLRLPNGIDADFCVFQGSEEELQALASS